MATLSILSALICGSLVIPKLLPTMLSERSTDLSIGQFNLYHGNDAIDEAILAIKRSNVDVVSVQELNAAWSGRLTKALMTTHPFTATEPWENCCYGIGLYSKYPIISSDILECDGIPMVVAALDVNGSAIAVISVHTQTPAFPDSTEMRNGQVLMVADLVGAMDKPCIVLGDLNMVPWDRVFKGFLESSNLRAVRSGFQATFPMDLGFPLIPIDHIMRSEGLSPTSCRSVHIPGSDHKGIVAGFHLD